MKTPDFAGCQKFTHKLIQLGTVFAALSALPIANALVQRMAARGQHIAPPSVPKLFQLAAGQVIHKLLSGGHFTSI